MRVTRRASVGPSALLPCALLLILVVSVAGLIALGGGVGRLLPGPLVADVTGHEFDLPSTFGVDPNTVAEDLTARLQRRAGRDPALRTILGDSAQADLRETVIPRLLNAGVLRRMIGRMDSLGTVAAVSDYRGLVTGTIANTSSEPVEDVALTLPGLLHAETADGDPLELHQRKDGVDAITFGPVAADRSVAFRAWLDAAPGTIEDFRDMVRIGAAGGLDGRVDLRGGEDWLGSALEVRRWARWLIAGVLALVAMLSFLALAASLWAAWRFRRA